jgi:hypothetical protein
VLRRDGSVQRDGALVAVEREGLPSDTDTCLPTPTGRGHVRITAASRVVRPTLEQRRVAVLLADQLPVGGSDPGGTLPPALTPAG